MILDDIDGDYVYQEPMETYEVRDSYEEHGFVEGIVPLSNSDVEALTESELKEEACYLLTGSIACEALEFTKIHEEDDYSYFRIKVNPEEHLDLAALIEK